MEGNVFALTSAVKASSLVDDKNPGDRFPRGHHGAAQDGYRSIPLSTFYHEDHTGTNVKFPDAQYHFDSEFAAKHSGASLDASLDGIDDRAPPGDPSAWSMPRAGGVYAGDVRFPGRKRSKGSVSGPRPHKWGRGDYFSVRPQDIHTG